MLMNGVGDEIKRLARSEFSELCNQALALKIPTLETFGSLYARVSTDNARLNKLNNCREFSWRREKDFFFLWRASLMDV